MATVEMQVQHVSLDPFLGVPVVVLKEKQGSRSIPIWIGQGEANAIANELNQVALTRPSSHDLMKELIIRLRAAVSHITVTDLQGGTFFAEVALQTPDGALTIDSRPSDAIALALRVRSPIFIEQSVMDRAEEPGTVSRFSGDGTPVPPPMNGLPEGGLETLGDEDFGSWKM